MVTFPVLSPVTAEVLLYLKIMNTNKIVGTT